jgi:hypothetical protein
MEIIPRSLSSWISKEEGVLISEEIFGDGLQLKKAQLTDIKINSRIKGFFILGYLCRFDWEITKRKDSISVL